MRKLSILLMVLTLAVAMIMPLSAANAASPQFEVSGTITMTMTGLIPQIVGADHLMKGEVFHHVTYTGDISGSGDEAGMMTYNLKSLALASVGVETFTGTVLGRNGTLTFHYFHGGHVPLVPGAALKVEQTIISGTGELANLRGTLHFTVYSTENGPYQGTYSGKLHFVD